MSANIQQHSPGCESATASIVFHSDTDGAAYDGPLCIGIYKDRPGEVWIEFDGVRRNIPASDIPALCKELKRAATIAAERSAP